MPQGYFEIFQVGSGKGLRIFLAEEKMTTHRKERRGEVVRGCVSSPSRAERRSLTHLCLRRTEKLGWDSKPGNSTEPPSPEKRGLEEWGAVRLPFLPRAGAGLRKQQESQTRCWAAAPCKSWYYLRSYAVINTVISDKPLAGAFIFTVIILFIMESFGIHVDITRNSTVI